MIFSHRYLRAIEQGTVSVELPVELRKKLWIWMTRHDTTVHLQRDPNDNWISTSSVLAEVEDELKAEHGWDIVPGFFPDDQPSYRDAVQHLVTTGKGHFVLDAIEMQYNWLTADEREAFRKKINEILELHECPWRISDGEFFKLDSDFVGARFAATAHDALVANRFAGASEEYGKARQELGAADIKDAILHASKSYESVLKVLTGLDHANADRLVKSMVAKGFLDDLPEPVRQGFANQILMALPFLRNKLAGHGQGAAIVDVPPIYGELAIQLAAALHNFLISKYLATKPSVPEPQALLALDDELPF